MIHRNYLSTQTSPNQVNTQFNTGQLARALCLLIGLLGANSNVYAVTTTIESDNNTPAQEAPLEYELLPESPPFYIPPDASNNTSNNPIETNKLTETITYQSSIVNTPEANADIWQRIKDGYAMPDANSALVKRHENAFAAQPNLVNNMVNRSQKYLFHIVEEVQNRGMPTELALLPMIESAYNPKAYSRSKAAGIWQFIPSTGSVFGLKQNWWVDNRRNITFATDAALTYLQKLHAMFGAWDLALAAYNAGEGTVRRAIEKNQRKGLPTNYSSLDLPKETRNYVPKLQAIKNIMTNPSNFGLAIKPVENKAYFTTVTAPAQIDSKLAAKLAGISDEEFVALNPAYNRPVIASKNGDAHELLLPIEAATTFQENLANYNKPLVSWKPYAAKRGESVASIANKFDIQVDQLRNINQLPSQKKMSQSATLLVPNGNKTDNIVAMDSTNAPLVDSDVDISNVQNAENIDAQLVEKLEAQRKIEASKETSANENVSYRVKNGDTLDKIAKKFGVSAKTIVSQNKLKKNQVKVGQTLTIKSAVKAKNNKALKKNSQSNKKMNKNSRNQKTDKITKKAKSDKKPNKNPDKKTSKKSNNK